MEVSPPTRGWTHLRGDHPRSDQGFPAHAGMDRTGTTSPERKRWFPRPRGDGPRFISFHLPSNTVSPPTRGWTLKAALRILRDVGFPAHAGMDPA